MPKFLITQVHSFLNKGDAAIAAGIIKTLRKKYPDCQITVLSATPKQDVEYYSRFNVQTQERLFNTIGRKRTKIRKALSLAEFVIKAVLYLLWTKINIPLGKQAESVLNLFASADLVLVGGGGSYGARKYGSILVDLFPIYFAKMLGKKVMVYAPSVEPFTSRIVRTFTKIALNKADVITVREQYSFDVLKELNIKRPVYLTADPAFLANYESREIGLDLMEKEGIPGNTKLRIGITMKNGELPPDPKIKTSYQRYVDAHVSAIETILAETDAIVVLFTTSIFSFFTIYDDDRIISYRVRSLVRESLRERVFVLSKNYTPEETKAMIGTMNMFVATRTHSGIFALSMNVPLLTVAYEYKTRGIMEMMGLEDRVLDIRGLTEQELIFSIRKLLHDRDLVVEKIKDRFPVVQEQALLNGEFVAQLMNHHQ